MIRSELKILAIKFKYLGDIAIMVPALRALREQWPSASLHVLVAEEAAPILSNLPWLDKVWSFHRSRGSASVQTSLPLIFALRKEHFNRSVDFVGNDRGAILSRCVGAPIRLGPKVPLGFWGRSLCYTQTLPEAPREWNEVLRDLHVLSAWNVRAPSSLHHEVQVPHSFKAEASLLLPEKNAIIAHIAASRAKKEWPLQCWLELARLANAAGIPIFFSSGTAEREQKQLAALMAAIEPEFPHSKVLPPSADLGLFLALIRRSRVFVSGDTGPLHFATGLGVPTVGIFGPTKPAEWAPLGPDCSTLAGEGCSCSGHAFECTAPLPCIGQVKPAAVWEQILKAYHRDTPAPPSH